MATEWMIIMLQSFAVNIFFIKIAMIAVSVLFLVPSLYNARDENKSESFCAVIKVFKTCDLFLHRFMSQQ